MKISWNERGIAPLPKYFRTILKQALLEAKRQEGQSPNEVSLTFVSTREIQELNNMYRKKDSATDVLSFPSSGDIIICVEVAGQQAETYGHSLERELAFLAVHGFLHLLGYDHLNTEDESIMKNKQEEILTKVGVLRCETKKE